MSLIPSLPKIGTQQQQYCACKTQKFVFGFISLLLRVWPPELPTFFTLETRVPGVLQPPPQLCHWPQAPRVSGYYSKAFCTPGTGNFATRVPGYPGTNDNFVPKERGLQALEWTVGRAGALPEKPGGTRGHAFLRVVPLVPGYPGTSGACKGIPTRGRCGVPGTGGGPRKPRVEPGYTCTRDTYPGMHISTAFLVQLAPRPPDHPPVFRDAFLAAASTMLYACRTSEVGSTGSSSTSTNPSRSSPLPPGYPGTRVLGYNMHLQITITVLMGVTIPGYLDTPVLEVPGQY
eukprot:1004893-Rhodomonas_salina.1